MPLRSLGWWCRLCLPFSSSEAGPEDRIVCRSRGDFCRFGKGGGGSDEPVLDGVRRDEAKEPAMMALVRESRPRFWGDCLCERLGV